MDVRKASSASNQSKHAESYKYSRRHISRALQLAAITLIKAMFCRRRRRAKLGFQNLKTKSSPEFTDLVYLRNHLSGTG
jgi:hypothetical protein